MIVPLKILITDGSLLANEGVKEQIDKLEKAGHSIVIDESLKQYDFICGPNCWLLRPEVANLFTMAVANARKVALADKERVEQVKSTKARKAPAKRVSKVSTRSIKTKAVSGAGSSGGTAETGSASIGGYQKVDFLEST